MAGRRFMVHVAAMLAIASTSLRLDAQTDPTIDAFEVSSIKPVGSESRGGLAVSSPDRFIRPDATLLDLIWYAYNVLEFQIEGGPGWMRSERFEVNARAAFAPAGPDGMRVLVRRLLGDRFALRTRIESRDMSRYDLVVACQRSVANP